MPKQKSSVLKMKKIFLFVFPAILIALAIIIGVNYSSAQKPIAVVLENDPRNSGIEMSAHYGGYIDPDTMVIDLKNVSGDKSPLDVFRVLLQFSNKIKDKKFDWVLLQSKGKTKFKIKGDYFQQLGQEYGRQNPVYTTRTFPENLYTKDGYKAFSVWTGGLLGVLKRQMEDFQEFNRKWFIEDM